MDLVRKPIGMASGGTLVLTAAVAGKITHLRTFAGALGANGSVQFVDSDGTPLTGPIPLAANTPLVIPAANWQDTDLTLATAAGKGISVKTTAALSGFAILTRD